MITLSCLQRKERFAILALVLLMGSFVFKYADGVRIIPKGIPFLFWNNTASLPRGLYFRIPFDDDFKQNLSKGDYVVYYPDDSSKKLIHERNYMPEGMALLKEVGALEGEHFYIDEETSQCYIGKRYIGLVADTDHEGRVMPVIRGEHIIPKDHFFPLGKTAYSFDGRYSGPIPIDNIVARVLPILVEF